MVRLQTFHLLVQAIDFIEVTFHVDLSCRGLLHAASGYLVVLLPQIHYHSVLLLQGV